MTDAAPVKQKRRGLLSRPANATGWWRIPVVVRFILLVFAGIYVLIAALFVIALALPDPDPRDSDDTVVVATPTPTPSPSPSRTADPQVEPTPSEAAQEPEADPPADEPVDVPEDREEDVDAASTLTSLFQTQMGYDAVGMMINDPPSPQVFGQIAFDTPDWWEADADVIGGYAELTYYVDPTNGSRFSLGAGLPPCEGDTSACRDERIAILGGDNVRDYQIDTVERPSLPGGTVTLMSRPDSSQDNGWSAVAFVEYDATLHEFLVGDSRDLASILATLDSVRPR